MIKVFLLILDPTNTWERIELEKSLHRVVTLFFSFALPVLAFGCAVEAWGLLYLGEMQGMVDDRVVRMPAGLVARYIGVEAGLSLLILFGGAKALQLLGASFHRRHTYTECFAAVAFALGPLFLFRALDALPAMNTWICWAIGAILAISVLYRGIPRLLKPDPSNALGLYLVSALVLIFLTGLAHFLAVLVLEEKILAGHGG
jgi:hypothetical protein